MFLCGSQVEKCRMMCRIKKAITGRSFLYKALFLVNSGPDGKELGGGRQACFFGSGPDDAPLYNASKIRIIQISLGVTGHEPTSSPFFDGSFSDLLG